MSYDENRISDLIDGGLQQQQAEFEKIEELLKPRWKCISKYPNALWAIGDIIKNRFSPVFVTDCAEYDIDYYENLFQPLPWYAERSVDDMPEYIIGRWQGEDQYVKVLKWEFDMTINAYVTNIDGMRLVDKYSKPITFEQYQSFKEKKL